VQMSAFILQGNMRGACPQLKSLSSHFLVLHPMDFRLALTYIDSVRRRRGLVTRFLSFPWHRLAGAERRHASHRQRSAETSLLVASH
jgi:hypothetical protein